MLILSIYTTNGKVEFIRDICPWEKHATSQCFCTSSLYIACKYFVVLHIFRILEIELRGGEGMHRIPFVIRLYFGKYALSFRINALVHISKSKHIWSKSVRPAHYTRPHIAQLVLNCFARCGVYNIFSIIRPFPNIWTFEHFNGNAMREWATHSLAGCSACRRWIIVHRKRNSPSIRIEIFTFWKTTY